MGVLVHLNTGASSPLPARLLIGRAPTCFVHLDQPLASAEHAVLEWVGADWQVKDLGSRNGTFVDGERLEPGQTVLLAAGSRVAFGEPTDLWRLDDPGPPRPLALDLASRDVVVGDEGLLVLPSVDEPEASVFRGADGRWHLERGHLADAATDQQVVTIAERTFCLLLPSAHDATPFVEDPLDLATVTFRFAVSRNEEHVDIALEAANRTLDLETRDHHYLLLTLARLRARDRDQVEAERGWVDRDELLKMLRMTQNAFNVAVHRARQQLLAVGVVGGASVVQVRRGERRFGSDRITIAQG